MEGVHSPIHDRHVALGAKFSEFGGWLMPLHYAGVVAEHRAAEVTAPELHAAMVGRGLQAEYYRESRQLMPTARVMVEARGLGTADPYANIDLSIRAGEIVGIAGVV